MCLTLGNQNIKTLERGKYTRRLNIHKGILLPEKNFAQKDILARN